MLKRLTFTVLMLGIFLAFGSAVFADLPDGVNSRAIPSGPGANPAKVLAQPGTVTPSSFFKAIPVPVQMATPVKNNPQIGAGALPGCDFISYWDGASAFDFSWDMAGANLGQRISMRFDTPAKHVSEITGTMFWTWGSSDVGGLGAPDVVVEIYDDNAGLPGNLVYSETFVTGAMATGYVFLPLTTPVQIQGNYHIALGASGGDPADELLYDSDDGGHATFGGTATGTARGSFYDGAAWFTNDAAFSEPGFDPNYDIWSESCWWFSDCFSMNGLESTGGCGSVGLWFVPDPAWTSTNIFNGIAQRFVAEGPETLTQVRVQHLAPAWFFGPLGGGYDGTSTNAFKVSVWGDDGTGNIDFVSGPLATKTSLGGLANMFPADGNQGNIPWEFVALDFTPDNLVLFGPYHISVELTSSNDADGRVLLGMNSTTSCPGGSGASVNFIGGANAWERSGTQADWLTEGGGEEQAFLVRPSLCRDEFAICKSQQYYIAGATSIFGLPLNLATMVKGNPVNRLESFRFQVWDDGAVAGSYGVDPVVWANSGGFPGAELWRGATLDALTSTPYPGWTEVVIPGGLVIFGDFFIGYEEASTNPDGAIAYLVEKASPEINNGAKYYSSGSGIWKDLGDVIGEDANALMEADFCSIPVDEVTCAPGTEWNTVNGDYARTGHSNDAIGDAWCDLDLAWQYEHPVLGTIRSGPVVSGDVVVQAFSSGTAGEYVVIDLTSGIPMYSLTSTALPQSIGGQIRCTPTIETVSLAGVPTKVLFIAGGTAASVSAYDLATGAQIWTMNPFNTPLPYLGHTPDPGTIRYGNFIILNDGAMDVLYFTDDNGVVFAANAADGTPYTPWGGGTALGGSPLRSGATDGTNLYFSLFTAGVEGDVLAIDAGTGALVWNVQAGDGLQAATFWGVDYTANSETFAAGVAVDGGEVYANSNASGGFPVQGLFYRLSAATGSVLSAEGGLNQTTTHPIVDAGLVMMFSRYTWGSGGNSPLGGSVVAFSRANGTISWVSTPPGSGTFDKWILYEGVLSCEPSGAPDILMGFSGGNSGDQGYLSFFNANDGNEIFHRRVDHGSGQNVGGPGALAVDGLGGTHVLFVDAWGTLYDLQKSGISRPRLEVLSWSAGQAVPFGSPYDTVVVFPAMYTNTGCADLQVDLVASDAANGVTVGSPSVTPVRDEFASFSDAIASNMSPGFKKFATNVGNDDVDGVNYQDIRANNNRSSVSRAALAVPAFLIENGTYAGDVFDPPGGAIVTAAGDTSGIAVHVDGPLINRGPQSFYAEFTVHNDQDYFLNDNTLRPQVFLTLVGGCLIDTTMLEFGVGAANFQWVFNTARSGDPDFPGDANAVTNLDIDGNENGNFAGFYVYGVSDHRIAMDAENWFGQGDDNSWISIQADPNFVDQSCKPNLAAGVSLGSFSTDGVTYSALTGNLISTNWIDSVQNFDDGFGGWDWSLFKTAPFDNALTMGLAGDSRIFGVVDAPVGAELLNSMHIEIFEMTERNGNAVADWKFGSFIDNDVVVDETGANFDTTYFDASVSSGWVTTDLGINLQSGYAKLPFGCGETPMKNAFNMERAQTATCGNSACAWDSLYFYMSMPANTPYGHSASAADDGDAFYTFVEHDFAANETFTFAVATYYFNGVADATVSDEKIAPAVNLANKWVGFGRGDVDNDDAISLGDIIYLAEHVTNAGPGPIPFMHLGDVDGVAGIDGGDVTYLVDYYFNYGSCPQGDWTL